MKLRAHHIVIVSRENADASTALPVPDPDSLIVRGAEDPRILVMEDRRPDVVEMPEKREYASSLLVIPDLDLVVVTAGNEQRLLIVEAYAANWTIVLVEFVQQRAHPVVPQLDNSIVQTVNIKSVLLCCHSLGTIFLLDETT